MGKRWRFRPHDAAQVSSLEKHAGIPPIVAQLLLCRGISNADAAKHFLEARLGGLRDPEELPGIPNAADRVHAAIQDRRRIVVYGDYDADGMTGTALLLLCLKLLGGNVDFYVPNRLEEGYGLNDQALQSLAGAGTSMVISIDCGIASTTQADTARRLGLELIVTDHHAFADALPDAAAIVHPRLPGTDYPFGNLCGAGVAFKLAWALCCRASESKKVSAAMREYLLSAVGLAAIGTVADVVPLVDENRIIVKHGLKSLKERPLRGLRALMDVAKLSENPSITGEDIAFSLAPRLNAAGRLGQAQLGVELLTTNSNERACYLAEYVDELNKRRGSLERSVYLAANKQIKQRFDPKHEPALVLADVGWHPGVIGIVAGRLAEKYHRPVVLVALDQVGARPGTGSGRSACGLNLHQALAECGQHLVSHGGHAAAAGLRIHDRHIDAFRAAFCEHAGKAIADSDRIQEICIDAEAPFSQLTLTTVQQIESMAPFGMGNPRPVLSATNVEIAETPTCLGDGDRHLAVRLSQHGIRMRAIAFGRGDWLGDLSNVEGTVDVVYRPVVNHFRGRRSVEVHLVDWRPSESTALAGGSAGTSMPSSKP